jgi:hypothetical protein
MTEEIASATPIPLIPDHWTRAQYRWLAHVNEYSSKTAAYGPLNVKPDTVEWWRYHIDGFRAAEDTVLGREGNRDLARTIAAQAAPQVMIDQVDSALMVPETDRDRTVKQRAAETVLRYADIAPRSSTDDIESLDILAIRIKRRDPVALTPPVTIEALDDGSSLT